MTTNLRTQQRAAYKRGDIDEFARITFRLHSKRVNAAYRRLECKSREQTGASSAQSRN